MLHTESTEEPGSKGDNIGSKYFMNPEQESLFKDTLDQKLTKGLVQQFAEIDDRIKGRNGLIPDKFLHKL